MAFLLPVLKNALKAFLDSIKKILWLDTLNYEESSGNICKTTKIKLMPLTSIKVPFSLGRTIRGVSYLDPNGNDPFALFCKWCSLGELDDNLVDYLYFLYKQESCKTAAEIVGFSGNICLASYPAWALVMPWESETLETRYRTYLDRFVENRSAYGYKFSNSQVTSAVQAFYSDSNARSQVLQTKNLWKSIKSNGLLHLKSLPVVFIMYDGSRWRWLMSGDGNHRAYLSNIFGNKFFVSEVRGVINRNDVDSWTNVKNRTYSQAEALTLFDSFFNGKKNRRGIV